MLYLRRLEFLTDKFGDEQKVNDEWFMNDEDETKNW